MARYPARIPRSLLAVVIAGRIISCDAAAFAAVAFVSVQNRPGDQEAAHSLDEGMRQQLGETTELVEPARVRDAMRRLRLRDIDSASPALLQRAAENLGAERLISVTLHDAERREVPRLTASAKVYDGVSGDLRWVSFAAVTGLDGRTVLGLGVVPEIETLARHLAGRLVDDIQNSGAGGTDEIAAESGLHSAIGAPWALVPFESVADKNALTSAEVLTAATLAAVFRSHMQPVSPNRVRELMRRRRMVKWGGLTRSLREALRAELGIETVLTGSVELYDFRLFRAEPEPKVTVALRLIDAGTGNILWLEGFERSGWERRGPFRAGFIYSRGALGERLVVRLLKQLIDERTSMRSGAQEAG